MNKRKYLSHLLALCFAISGPTALSSQVAEDGTVEGTVTDSRGDDVPEVNVSAFESGAVPFIEARTGANGAYKLKLAPGNYTIQFALPGFRETELRHVTVRAGQTLKLSLTLVAGQEDERVEKEWTPAPVADGPTANDPAASDEAVTEIPLASRNYTQAAGMASGVSSQVSNATAMGMNSQGVPAGSSPTNNYMVDGVTVATQTGDADQPAAPNPDAIESHQVQSWNYSAGPERYAGATIGVSTKSGGNSFHGTLFEFVRNDIFNSNDYFLKQKGFEKPVLKQNQFGFTFGGPVVKDKAFFFLAYQGTRQRNGFANNGFSPSASLPPLPATRTAATVGAAMCPDNHPGDDRYKTIFDGIQVACDGSTIGQVAINILNLKLPNGDYAIPGSTNGTFQTVPRSIPASFREDQAILNTDLVLSPKHKLTEKYFYSHDPQLSNFSGGRNTLPGMKTRGVAGDIYAQLRLTSTFSPVFVNELSLSGQREQESRTPENPFTNEQVGISSVVPGINMLDIITVSGLFNMGGGTQWDTVKVNQYQLAERVAWTRGIHSLKFGVEVDNRQWNIRSPGYARGLLNFQRFADFLIGRPGCPPGSSGCSASNPVVNGVLTNGGQFSNVYASLGPNGGTAYLTSPAGIEHAYRFTDASGYFQDSIQLNARLTLSLGLRWDFLGLPSDSSGNLTNFWTSRANPWTLLPASGTYSGYVVPSNRGGTLPDGVIRNSRRTSTPDGTRWTAFAPRVGFSYQPLRSSRTILRGGYGIFYDRVVAWDLEQQAMAAVPYAVPVGSVGTSNYQASLARPYRQATLGWGSPRSVDFTSGESSNHTAFIMDENYGSPQTQKWNLEIQQQLPWGVMLNVGYAGAHSIHLQVGARQINVPELATPTHPIYGITTSTVANAPLRVPYLGFAPNGLTAAQTQGSAKYHGLQAAVNKRAANGMHVQASYMFSKTLTNLGAAPSISGNSNGLAGSGMNSNNSLDARQQYGPAPGNSPQRLAISYGWELPWKLHGFSGRVVNGWDVSGTGVIQAGTPMTLSDGRGGTIYGNATISRAQFCPGMSAKDAATTGGVRDRLGAWFNKAAFCAPPAIGNGVGYGNTSVGFIRGPGQENIDVALSKSIELKGSTIQFRAEFFNALNHPQFAAPNANVTDGPFGQISATSVNPRLIQFALKFSF